MGIAGYLVSGGIALLSGGLGVRNGMLISRKERNAVSVGHALGEGMPHVAYCLVGIYLWFVSSCEWAILLVCATGIATLLTTFALLVYASTAHQCNPTLGHSLVGFHTFRILAMVIALSAIATAA